MSEIADSAFFSTLARSTRFFILRHGQSEGNAQRLFQGSLDLPLDAEGRRQALDTGKWLGRQGIDAVLCSPLARAAETARIASEAGGLGEPRAEALFAEIDTGIFTGLGFAQARERHPEVFAAFEGQSWEAVPGAERAQALYDRAIEAWRLLRAEAEGGRRAIACFSHGGFIQWLVRSTFGCRSWMPLVSTSNCGIFELLVEPGSPGSAYLHWRLWNFQAPAGPPAPGAYGDVHK
jgi:broad specificity phosphatase PhoE